MTFYKILSSSTHVLFRLRSDYLDKVEARNSLLSPQLRDFQSSLFDARYNMCFFGVLQLYQRDALRPECAPLSSTKGKIYPSVIYVIVPSNEEGGYLIFFRPFWISGPDGGAIKNHHDYMTREFGDCVLAAGEGFFGAENGKITFTVNFSSGRFKPVVNEQLEAQVKGVFIENCSGVDLVIDREL